MVKSNYTKDDIQRFVSNKLGENVELNPVVEGIDSQVYSYSLSGKEYIVRINSNLEGFRKDDYAYSHFKNDVIPIPKVIDYGKYNDIHYYCISEKANGITFEDSKEEVVEKLLPDITKIMIAINNIDISNTTGFGIFDSETGNATFNSWQEYLFDILNEEKYHWEDIKRKDYIDSNLIDDMVDEFKRLIPYCGNKRKLRHGDFGSNNMLVDNDKFTAVIDWDCAGYGDPLHEVASAHFWSTWLMCMDKTSKYYDSIFANEENYNERILCYQLHIGLTEIYENAIDDDIKEVTWLQNRCREIYNTF